MSTNQKPAAAGQATAQGLPPQATMGPLDYLTTHTLDEDYAFVSEQKRQPSGGPPTRRIGVVGAVMMARIEAGFRGLMSANRANWAVSTTQSVSRR